MHFGCPLLADSSRWLTVDMQTGTYSGIDRAMNITETKYGLPSKLNRSIVRTVLVAIAISFAACSPDPTRQNLCALEPSIESIDGTLDAEFKLNILRQYIPHAVFSAVSYRQSGWGFFEAPDGWLRSETFPDDSGLSLSTFERADERKLVVAFRGTDEGRDWAQNVARTYSDRAKTELEEIIALDKYSGWDVTVTGHSLGGGLAIEMSHRLSDVNAVAFNPSPNLGALLGNSEPNRVIVREKFEPLAFLRGNPISTVDWLLDYNILVDFTSGVILVRPLEQHSMDQLAMNLIAVVPERFEEVRDLWGRICTQGNPAQRSAAEDS